MKQYVFSLSGKLISILLLVTLAAATIAASYYLESEENHLNQLLRKQGVVLFNQVQTAWHWNASHSGVYVLMKKGEKTNPYLYKVGPGGDKPSTVEPELTDTHGRKLTLKNPALMTRELAEESKEHTDVRFHLTSLKLINPDNKPDDFERAALLSFEQGRTEASHRELIDGKPYYRYMAPLKVEKACLQCHGFQGYKVGDVRGGLSVAIPMQEDLLVAEDNRHQTIAFGFVLMLAMMLALAVSVQFMIGRPLRKLLAFTHGIGGDEKSALQTMHRNDEIGALSRAISSADDRVRTQAKDLRAYAQNMAERSYHDELTGLYNRHYLSLASEQWFDEAKRKNRPLCVVLADLDYFKQVNDKHGHQVGDRALRHVANILNQERRTYDQLVRYGGDEFLMIFPDTELDDGIHICERMRSCVASSPLAIESGELALTMTMGVYSCMESTLEAAIICADEALYRAKADGRNRVAK